jgi:NADPH-dependent curcumin reductase CurA
MAEEMNRRVVLVSRPKGEPTEANFRLESSPIPRAGPDEFLLRNHWLSVDPYMRGRMSDAPSYAKPVPIGGVMEGGTAGEVVQSNTERFSVGEFVVVRGGWQDFRRRSGLRVCPALPPTSACWSSASPPPERRWW